MRTVPTITVTIEIAVTIITIPVSADIKGDDRNAKVAVITRLYINPVLTIFGLNVAAGNPATTTAERDITPWCVGKAAMDNQRRAFRNDNNRWICGARA
jgi:hypothetical protein